MTNRPELTNRGFTLVELLVTVAIIGILAAMAIAQFTEYRARAYDAVALSQARSAYTALHVNTDPPGAGPSSPYAGATMRGTRTIHFQGKGTVTNDSNFSSDSGLSAEQLAASLLPGFSYKEGVNLFASAAWDIRDGSVTHLRYLIHAFHCQGTSKDDYAGSRRTIYVMDSDPFENTVEKIKGSLGMVYQIQSCS